MQFGYQCSKLTLCAATAPTFTKGLRTTCSVGDDAPASQKLAVLPKNFIKGKTFALGQTSTGELTHGREAICPRVTAGGQNTP